MKTVNLIACVLLIIGGLNWGSVGLFDVNFVDRLLGPSVLERIVYILVGVAAILHTVCLFRCCKKDHHHGDSCCSK